MKYFERYLTEATAVEDIDISVHCDIKIFEWLMRYLKPQGKAEERPQLDIKNVISILISSEFLQMESLVDQCLDFILENIESVVRLPIDMNCLNSGALKKIADKISIEKLTSLIDKKDKLQSKLFMKKLQSLIAEEEAAGRIISRCTYCNQLFTQEQHEWMHCP